MKTLRNVVSVADRLSPRVAAQLALRLFLTPPRAPRPAREVALLAVASPLTVLLDRHAIAAWTWGEGPTVLLVHGWGGRGTQLGALIPPLVNAGYRVVAFDGTAHGDTDGRLTTLAQLARVITAVADAAGGIDAVVAHSFGAAATTVALAHGLAAKRAVYVAPVFEIAGAVERYAAAAGLSERATALFRTGVAQANRATAEQLDGHTLAPRQTAALTVIHDVGDREVPFAEGEAAARAWPGARLVETSGLGHRRILDDADVVGIIRDVVAGRAVAPRVLDDAWRIERELLDRDSRRTRAFP